MLIVSNLLFYYQLHVSQFEIFQNILQFTNYSIDVLDLVTYSIDSN